MNVITTTTTSSGAIHPRQRMVQNFFLIWLDANIDESKQECKNILAQLRSVINHVNIFTQSDEAIDFLTEVGDIKTFLIIGGIIAQQIVPLIHDIRQLDSIYITCDNRSPYEKWTKQWDKIKDVNTEIMPICESLQQEVKQSNQDSIAISFVELNEEISNKSLDQLEPTFMYTQIFKEILLSMKYDRQSVKNFTTYCRNGDYGTLSNINRFENEYSDKSAIWWYTFLPFTYSMLNCALRNLEAEIIIEMGFFIHDLHNQIQQLHQQQAASYHGETFIVYRGQGLSTTDFHKLLKAKSGLIFFNNFLSTSKNEEVSVGFANAALFKTDMVGILFKIHIDPSVLSAPFASIREISYFDTEEEVLFSMHTVFRIDEIYNIDNNNSLYQVDLKLTADDDAQLRTLTECIQEEVTGKTGWKRLGQLLLKLSQLDKAEKLYNILLDQTTDEAERAHYYNQLGYIKDNQGDYGEANNYHKKALEIEEKALPPNHPSLATSYNNIGAVYDNMGEYSKALSFYEKALEIRKKAPSPNHPSLATSYSNIGLVYKNMGDYSKALSFYEKALEIRGKALPPNHPDLATSYNNIGMVYRNMGEYSKAVSFYEKALGIEEKALPPNHPLLATSYNNFGGVYDNMGEYSKALLFYEKALEIQQKALPPNHPLLATSYNNFGGMYDNMGDYSKALSFYEKAIEIEEKALPSNHPSLATSYNNIGLMYKNMGEYSKALSFHKKALEIERKALPPNHPSLATSYNNIGGVYNNMGEYPKALLSYEKALEIQQKTLPPNHPNLAGSYGNIGLVYDNMGDYSKALLFHEKALEIKEKVLPPNHPDLATTYNNIGLVYDNMEDYSKALSFYEKAIEICQKALPSNHPNLAGGYNNIGRVYDNMEDYSKALSFYEKALEIQQKTLPENHSDFAYSYNNSAAVCYNMGDYSNALSYSERALSIFQSSLPPDHPHIQIVQSGIEIIKKEL